MTVPQLHVGYRQLPKGGLAFLPTVTFLLPPWCPCSSHGCSMCYETTRFGTQGCVTNAWLGQRKQDFFFTCRPCLCQPSSCDIAHVRDGWAGYFLQQKRGVSACHCTAALPFPPFPPHMHFASVLVVGWYLALGSSYWVDNYFFSSVLGQTCFLPIWQTESAPWEVR